MKIGVFIKKHSLFFIGISIFFSGIFFSSCVEDPANKRANELSSNPVSGNHSLARAVYSSHNIVLATIRKWRVYGYDQMLTNSTAEDGAMWIADNIAVDSGQFAYIPAYAPTPGDPIRNTMYRGYRTNPLEHMATYSSGELTGTYTQDGILGHLWGFTLPSFMTSSPSVLTQENSTLKELYRAYKPFTSPLFNEYDTRFITNNIGDGYINQLDSRFGYVFQRYGTASCVSKVINGAGPSGGAVTVTSNKVYGGAISQINWDGVDFINAWFDPPSRLMTFVINRGVNNDWDYLQETGQSCCNPDRKSYNTGIAQAWRAGSPLTMFSSPSTKKIVSEVFPLLAQNADFLSGSGLDPTTHSVMWDGRFGKTVEINPFGDDHPGIILWKCNVMPPSGGDDIHQFDLGIHLNNQFNTFMAYNPFTDELYPLDIPNNEVWGVTGDLCRPIDISGGHPELHWEEEGVIISTSDFNHALGMYHKGSLGYYDGFSIVNYTNSDPSGSLGPVSGIESYNCSAIHFALIHALPATSFSAKVYVVIGTVDQVKAAMLYMHQHKATDINDTYLP